MYNIVQHCTTLYNLVQPCTTLYNLVQPRKTLYNTDMSTHQRIGAVSAPLENSQRFQRILTFLSVKNSAKMCKNLQKVHLYSGKNRFFALKNRFSHCTDCTGVQFRADRAEISARFCFPSCSFMFSARKQREMPFFSKQREFALIFQREQKGCCRHVCKGN